MSDFIKGDPNKNLIPVFVTSGDQKDVEVTAGPGIAVLDESTPTKFSHRVSAVSYTPLTTSLGLVAKALGVVKATPILKGTIIDEVNLTFAYNKPIASQTLSNTGALAAPVLTPADVLFNYVGQNIGSSIDFTLQGNDGLGQSGSIASDTKGVSFGNILYLGAGPSQIGKTPVQLETFIDTLLATVKLARQHTYFATGGANQKHFVAYPKAFGLATFTKGIFAGGYVRLKSVGGAMQFEDGIENDVIFTNPATFAEAYYIYESLYDNQNDPVTPFIIS